MPPVVAAAAIGAGASLLGGAINARQSGKAVDAQTNSANQALAEQKRIFDMQQAQRAPYLAQSQQSLAQLGQMVSQQKQMQLPPAYTGGGMRSLSQLGQPMQPLPQRPMPPPMPQGQPPMGQPSPSAQVPQTPNQPMGLFEAPTGERRPFPLAMQAQLESHGVKRVG